MLTFALACIALCAVASLVAVVIERHRAFIADDRCCGGLTFPIDGDRS